MTLIDRTVFYEVLRDLKCDDRDKESCFSTAAIMLHYLGKVKRHGLLSLEKELDSIDDDFMKHTIDLLTCGNAPETIYDILMTAICSSRAGDTETLRKLVILEGVFSILAREKDDYFIMRLYSLLGENYRDRFLEYLKFYRVFSLERIK